MPIHGTQHACCTKGHFPANRGVQSWAPRHKRACQAPLTVPLHSDQSVLWHPNVADAASQPGKRTEAQTAAHA